LSTSPSSALRFQFMLLIAPQRRSTSHIERLSISTGHAVLSPFIQRHPLDRVMGGKKVRSHFNAFRAGRKY
jgi:hypothetical protein